MSVFQSGSIYDPALRSIVTINGTDFLVWDEKRVENFAHGIPSQKATWVCRCLYEDRIKLATAILGGSTNIAGTTLYVDGWPYPDNHAWLAQQVMCEPDGMPTNQTVANQQPAGGASVLGNFQRAKVTTTFGIPDFDIGQPNNIGEQELDFSSNSVPLSQDISSFLWVGGDDDGKPLPINMSSVLRYTTVQFTQSRYNVAILPVNTVTSLVDCVNNGTFFGAATETVLFKGARSSRTITPTGATNWTVTFSFEQNRNGWNKLYNSKTSTWTSFTKNDGSKLFTPSNLSALYTA